MPLCLQELPVWGRVLWKPQQCPTQVALVCGLGCSVSLCWGPVGLRWQEEWMWLQTPICISSLCPERHHRAEWGTSASPACFTPKIVSGSASVSEEVMMLRCKNRAGKEACRAPRGPGKSKEVPGAWWEIQSPQIGCGPYREGREEALRMTTCGGLPGRQGNVL